MRCTVCNKKVKAFEKSDSQLLVGHPSDMLHMALACSECGEIICGECAQENRITAEFGASIPVCPKCSEPLGPYEA